jgi:hypothetical protein
VVGDPVVAPVQDVGLVGVPAVEALVLQPHFVIWPGVVCRCHVDG